jgi:hypothetical protein
MTHHLEQVYTFYTYKATFRMAEHSIVHVRADENRKMKHEKPQSSNTNCNSTNGIPQILFLDSRP